jgi:hypothetical protein
MDSRTKAIVASDKLHSSIIYDAQVFKTQIKEKLKKKYLPNKVGPFQKLYPEFLKNNNIQ